MMETPRAGHIGNVIRDARIFNPKNWQGDIVNTIGLPQTVRRLFTLLYERKIAYVLVGGIALLQYVDGRNTEDIDLIIALSDLQKLPEVQIINKNVYFAQGKFESLDLDFLLTENPLFSKIQQNHTTSHHFMENDVQCVTVEGLILLKLYALPSLYRQAAFAKVGMYENDIATLLHYYQSDLAVLLHTLKDYLNATDFAEIQKICEDLKRRLARFQQYHTDT